MSSVDTQSSVRLTWLQLVALCSCRWLSLLGRRVLIS